MVWKLLKEVLKVGEATVLYPFVPAEVSPGFRGKPAARSRALHCLCGLRRGLPVERADHG